MSDDLFQIKGSVLTTLILDVVQYDTQQFSTALGKKIQSAPQFFNQSPVMINLEKLVPNGSEPNLQALFQDCKTNGLQPIGLRGAEGALKSQAETLGLPIFPPASRSESVEPKPSPQPEPPPQQPVAASEPSVKTVTVEKLVSRPSKLVTQPVRSGQQLYAAGSDLVVLSHVSEGAEVIADGHIHVYGALRGRAIAGAKGDEEARIFCSSMEAEIISLAGNFVLNEDLREKCWRQAAQCFLQQGAVTVKAL